MNLSTIAITVPLTGSMMGTALAGSLLPSRLAFFARNCDAALTPRRAELRLAIRREPPNICVALGLPVFAKRKFIVLADPADDRVVIAAVSLTAFGVLIPDHACFNPRPMNAMLAVSCRSVQVFTPSAVQT